VKRGDIVLVALPGDYGKPRPALIVQNDRFALQTSVVLVPLTSDVTTPNALRIMIDPTEQNGLLKSSQIMTDKIRAHPTEKIAAVIGSIEPALLAQVNDALLILMDLA
jgi:mRNA interferase MazF